MDSKQALDVVGAAFADPGKLTDEREVQLGAAITVLVGSLVTSLERIADAQENLVAIQYAACPATLKLPHQ